MLQAGRRQRDHGFISLSESWKIITHQLVKGWFLLLFDTEGQEAQRLLNERRGRDKIDEEVKSANLQLLTHHWDVIHSIRNKVNDIVTSYGLDGN